MLLITATGRQ